MHVAARDGRSEAAKILINNGANVDAVDEVSMKYLLYHMLVMCPLQSRCNHLPLQLLNHFNIAITFILRIINYNSNYFFDIAIIITTCRMYIFLHDNK